MRYLLIFIIEMTCFQAFAATFSVNGQVQINASPGDDIQFTWSLDQETYEKGYYRPSADDQCGAKASRQNKINFGNATGILNSYIAPCQAGRKYKYILVTKRGNTTYRHKVVINVAPFPPSLPGWKQQIFGVNDDNFNELEIRPRIAADAGFGWIRIPFYWDLYERQEGKIEWATIDKKIAFSKKQGLKVLLNFMNVPPWANGVRPDCEMWLHRVCNAPPFSAKYFLRLTRAVAERYKNDVDAYQIFNEVNSSVFWLDQSDKGLRKFVNRILKPGIRTLRNYVPNIPIASPALQDTRLALNGGDPWAILMFQENGSSFDIFTFHLYGSNYNNLISTVNWLKSDVGLGTYNFFEQGKKIWITEMGINSKIVGNEIQATHTTQILNDKLVGNRPIADIDKIFLYRITDGAPSERWFGLVTAEPEMAPKPLFFSVRFLLLGF